MIKKVFCIIVFSSLTACTTVVSHAPDSSSTSPETIQKELAAIQVDQDNAFEILRQRALIDDLTLNYSDLRESYSESSNYRPYASNERTVVSELFALIDIKEYESCLTRSAGLLNINFISLGGHYTRVICFKESGDEEKAYLHEQILDGLLDSITRSGDGKSTETAFVTYSSAELYTFLNIMGLQAKGQAVVNENGKIFDAMQVSNSNSKNSEEFTLYFDISKQMIKGFTD